MKKRQLRPVWRIILDVLKAGALLLMMYISVVLIMLIGG